jgi:hypothetical protein
MGNKIQSPAFSYDAVSSAMSTEELNLLKSKFKKFCGNEKGGGAGLLDSDTFIEGNSEGTCPYLVENFLPRLFELLAGGAGDAQTVRFEDYVGALTLFRLGSQEDKLKCKEIMFAGLLMQYSLKYLISVTVYAISQLFSCYTSPVKGLHSPSKHNTATVIVCVHQCVYAMFVCNLLSCVLIIY